MQLWKDAFPQLTFARRIGSGSAIVTNNHVQSLRVAADASSYTLVISIVFAGDACVQARAGNGLFVVV